ncbi:MAG: hypothetical protein AAFR61_02210 [Bacteroidota bacterium]
MEKWRWMAPLGLVLIGLGFSLAGQAIILKMEAAAWYGWVGLGTLGLSVFNAGIAVFGEAVKESTLAAWKKRQENGS